MNLENGAFAYSDGDIDTNATNNPSLNELAAERYSRRQALRGGISALTAATLGATMLAGCDFGGDDDNETPSSITLGDNASTSSGRVMSLSATVSGDNFINSQIVQTGGPTVAITSGGTAANPTASFIAPSVSAATALTFQATATGAGGRQINATSTVTVNPAVLGFTAVAKNRNDVVTVPAGYSVTVMTRVGDPIAAGVAAYRNDGTDTEFDKRIGDHGDALYWYGLSAGGARDDNANTRGLMVQNHENLNIQYLHPQGPTNPATGPRPPAEAIKEIEAHGVSVTEYRDSGNRQWSWVQDSQFNRRITPNTPVVFHGPVRGTDFLKTVASTDGTSGRGTINNCANGHTSWGTNLTCEENWAFYFRRDNAGAGTDNALRTPRELTALRRYGVTSNIGNYAWSTAGNDPMFRRWDARATGASALADYRNEPNQFGWVVEFDPYDKSQPPRKRTALGRMGHEGAWLGKLTAGRKVSVYLGDDARNEYMYKFVSNANWDPADAQATNRLAVGDKYLDAGTLYVARYNADGTGQWVPLVFGQVPNRVVGADTYVFENQADILVNTRLAADAVGATRMDRPEWTATNNVTGEIYLTLTNNRVNERPFGQSDAANPRQYVDPKLTGSNPAGNPNGHIIRMRENGDDPGATSFAWDIYLFGADSADADPANVNLSNLNATNDFSSPDGLWFARPQNASGQVKPVLWIQTDDGAFTDRTNNQMLAAMPGTTGDGGTKTITNTVGAASHQRTTYVGAPATEATLKRFLTGPIGCEITGVDTTPDGRTLFVGVQHPGEDGTTNAPDSHWPDSQATGTAGATVRPRSAIVAITKDDGGVVAL